MEAYPPASLSPSTAGLAQRIRRARVIGFTGAGVCFVVSQVGLMWVLATGGIGSNPSLAVSIWLFSALAAGLFLLVVGDSYREHPRWLADRRETSVFSDDNRDAAEQMPVRAS